MIKLRKFGMAPLMKVPATTIRKVFMPVGWCSVGRNVLFSTQKTEMQIQKKNSLAIPAVMVER